MELVNQESIITVSDLAASMKVNPSAIRGDLTKLVEEGYLERTHDSPKLINEDRAEQPYAIRLEHDHQDEAKRNQHPIRGG